VAVIDRQPGVLAGLPGVPYIRDLGGWKASGGQVRTGLLFRSAPLARAQDAEALALADLGIRSIYDLRGPMERAQSPDHVPAGVEYIGLDVLSDIPTGGPGQMTNALADPRTAERLFGNRKALLARFEEGYRHIIALPSALDGYHRFFEEIAGPEHHPALVHCATGKDRTAWAAAALLLLLGVDEDDVYADYLLTNRLLRPALLPVVDRFVAAGGDGDMITPFIGVEVEYLDVAVDEMRHRFGSIDGYFSKGLRLDAKTIDELRAVYLDPAK
jgi:protein-tyrosine phosphatase